VEGVGLDRVTQNFSQALIDSAQTVSDQRVLDIAHAALRLEGLFLGSSSALNLAVACATALSMPENSDVVTIACDNGARHLSRFWNEDFVHSRGLQWPREDEDWTQILLKGSS
jgi:cysteine synthase